MSILSNFVANGFRSLASHAESVEAGTKIEKVYELFQKETVDFIAVLRDKRYLGTVSRAETMALLSGRYGFPLFARKPVEEHLLREQLTVHPGTPVREALEQALSLREKEEFHHDIVLLDNDERYLGMIPAHNLVKLQWDLMNEDAEQIQNQRSALETRNREIMENLSQLRKSRGRWQSLFDRAPLATALVDNDGAILDRNPEFDKLVEKTGKSISAIHELFVAEYWEQFQKLMAQSCECQSNLRSGIDTKIPCVDSSRGVLIARTVISCIPETKQLIVVLEDVTEQRNIERQLLDKEKSKILDNLVGGIAHELNNKLSPLLGFLSLCDSQKDSEFDLNAVAPVLREATQDAATILRQLLDLSRPPALDRKVLELSDLIRSTLDFLRYEARKRECELVYQEGHIEQDTRARIDAGQIRQVLINLVLNAFDAVSDSENREIVVEVSASSEEVFLRVVDSGQGISQEDQDRIFDSFFTTKNSGDGSGLGLSICRNIARLHDGTVAVSSVHGEKTVFTVSLPRVSDSSAKTTIPMVEESRTREEMEFPQLRALVVDDEPYVLTFVKKALKAELGIECITAEDGEAAVRLLKSDAFDLIISDVRMPIRDGFGLLQWIQDNHPGMVSRFLFVTGDAGGSVFEEKLQHLSPPVLRKPFVIDDLSSACTGLILTPMEEQALCN